MAKTGKKSTKKSSRKAASIQSGASTLGISQAEASWVEHGLALKTESGTFAEIYIETSQAPSPQLKKKLETIELQSMEKSSNQFFQFPRAEGFIFVKKVNTPKSKEEMSGTAYSIGRDAMGGLMSQLNKYNLNHLTIQVNSPDIDFFKGVIVGLDLAHYEFKKRMSDSPMGWSPSLELKFNSKKAPAKTLRAAIDLAKSTNLSRHLVSLPPNLLNPSSYAQAVQNLFKNSASMKVDVWDEARLKKENMGLLLGVGQAAEFPPCLVHLQYRPKGAANKKPIAFVGKGITFDSGGLDLKPAQFMRWMKKDMGGSASVVGIARWADLSGCKKPMDFYLALAENAVAGNAFRPGDILTSRSGQTVEIHNTDAEGRLALADAIDVAVTQTGKNKPEKLIDIATLTGAIKAGLGADVAGLFSNDLKMRDKLFKASKATADFCWPMPLYRPYWSSMSSPVSDFANSSDGYGGAITAALFLEKFTRDIPWAHLDIYGWTDSSSGALREKGGNGQAVQMVAEFLS